MKDRRDRDSDAGEDPRRVTIPVRELVRRALNTGAEAVQLTEESLKAIVGEVNARETVSGLFESVSKGTDTLQSVLVRESRRYLDAINFRDELGKVLSNYSIEVNATVNFVPREKAIDRKGRRSRGTDRDASLETEKFKVRFIPKDSEEQEETGAAEREGTKR